MTLQEFFTLYSVPGREHAAWNHHLREFDWEDVKAGLQRTADLTKSTKAPAVAIVVAEIRAVAAQRRQRERREDAESRGVTEENSQAELQLMGYVAALNRRGIVWNFRTGRWCAKHEPGYTEAWNQPLGRGAAIHGAEPLLSVTTEAWKRYVEGEDPPLPFAAGRAAAVIASEYQPRMKIEGEG